MKVLDKLLNKHLSLILPSLTAKRYQGERQTAARSVKFKLHHSLRKGPKALTCYHVSSIKKHNRFLFPVCTKIDANNRNNGYSLCCWLDFIFSFNSTLKCISSMDIVIPTVVSDGYLVNCNKFVPPHSVAFSTNAFTSLLLVDVAFRRCFPCMAFTLYFQNWAKDTQKRTLCRVLVAKAHISLKDLSNTSGEN